MADDPHRRRPAHYRQVSWTDLQDSPSRCLRCQRLLAEMASHGQISSHLVSVSLCNQSDTRATCRSRWLRRVKPGIRTVAHIVFRGFVLPADSDSWRECANR